MTGSRAPGFIYLIKPVGLPGPIKIGFSGMPLARLEALATWSPIALEVIARFPGTHRLEKNLHECLANSHSHHEWFFPTAKVSAFVAAIVEGKPVEQAINLDRREGRLPRKKMSDEARLRSTYVHRLRHHKAAPRDVEAIIRRWQIFNGRPPTDAEMQRLQEALPSRLKCRAARPTKAEPEACA